MKPKLLGVIALFCSINFSLKAQSSAHHLSTAVVQYFSGEWDGQGSFANGKTITSHLVVHPTLDSAWLSFQHEDKSAPFYKSQALWGTDGQTGEFEAYIFDNYQGHRQFSSSGWHDDQIILTDHVFYPKHGLVYEHFIYQKQDAKHFILTYEVSQDGIHWRLGDKVNYTKF